MTFDAVSIPAVVFVCVNAVLALIGNPLVLLVFGFRWRSTNDTKIYIMTLAVLDLCCALVSTPRDVITLMLESQDLKKENAMQLYCKLSIFLTHHLNVTSALILLAIATSRFVKVTKRDTSGDDLKSSSCPGLKALVKRAVRGMSTVRGAKVASVMAVVIALMEGIPALVVYGTLGDTGDVLPHNISETSPLNLTISYARCRDSVDPRYKNIRAAFDIVQFVLFIILTAIMMGIYSAVMKAVCCREASYTNSGLQTSAFFCPDSAAGRLPKDTGNETSPENPSVRQATLADQDTKENTEPGSPTSSAPLVLNEHVNTGERPTPDPLQSADESDQITFFPSLSYVSDQGSEPAVSRQSSHQARESHNSRRLSTASFQLTKTGNRAMLTTLVFLVVTFIYIVSYFPYFVAILCDYLVEYGLKPPWREWGAASLAVLKICRRSYLIASAANPLVYTLCNPYFREQLGKLLICRRDVI